MRVMAITGYSRREYTITPPTPAFAIGRQQGSQGALARN